MNADDAFAAAEAEIEKVRAAGGTTLDLTGAKLAALTRLPDSIATLNKLETLRLGSFLRSEAAQVTDLAPLQGLTGLQRLTLSGTKVTDLAPLQGLTGLQSLDLDSTQVTDLAPLQGLTGLQSLDLGGTQVTDLAPLQGLTGLQSLDLDGTQVTDLAPLQGLTGMQSLYLSNTQVTDLRPLLSLDLLWDKAGEDGPTDPVWAIWYDDTPATRNDPTLAELAQIKDNKERAQKTRAYLQTLPPWPEPLPTARIADGGEPVQDEDADSDFESQVAEEQIEQLMAHAAVHRVQASVTASQIRFAIENGLKPGANDRPRILRLAERVADVLDTASESYAEDRAGLQDAIADLERQVAALTQALNDATERAEAEKALADGYKAELDQLKDEGGSANGFWADFRSKSGETAGDQATKLPFFLAKSGVVYYLIATLGPDHQLVKLLLDLLDKIK